MRLPLICWSLFLTVSFASPSPFLMDWVSNITDTSWASYLPDEVQNFVNETVSKGSDLISDLYDDIMDEVVNKVTDNVSDLASLFLSFTIQMMDLQQSLDEVWARNESLSEEDKNKTDTQLLELKERFDLLQEKVDLEMKNETSLSDDSMYSQMQKTITTVRSFLTKMIEGQGDFWGTMKEMEVESYKFFLLLGDSSEELKEKLKSLFESLEKVDLPKLGSAEEENKE